MFRNFYLLMSALGGDGGDGSGNGAASGDGGANPPSNDGGDGGQQTSPNSVVIPDNWKDAIPEDLRGEKSLEHITSLDSLVKSYVHGQKMIGADKFHVPTEHSTDEEWNAAFAKLGRPESADGYELSPLENDRLNEDFLKSFAETAHKSGLSKRQVGPMLEMLRSTAEANEAAALEAAKGTGLMLRMLHYSC